MPTFSPLDPAHILIMVVDDEPVNFDVIDPPLTDAGYTVTYAPNAERALARLEAAKTLPNLILMDVMMPGVDGIELCKRIKQNPQWQQIPIIMITALVMKKDLARCFEAGADDFISKPVDNQELLARVRSVLNLYHQQRQIQNLLIARDAMFHSIVHDLRNPLNSILFTAEILKENDFQITQKHWERLNRSVEKMSRLVNDILILGKLESAKLTPNYEPVELLAFGDQALQDAAPFAEQKNITLIGKFPENNASVSLDFYLVRRAIDNLLMNAIKFSSLNSQIIFEIQQASPATVEFMIADLGYGIPDDQKAVIFEPYTSTDSSQDVAKIGLGLTFCKTVAEVHGGSITVENNQPQGSIFTLQLKAMSSAIN